MGATRKAYPAEFRTRIVELVRSGRKPLDLAQEFEHQTLFPLAFYKNKQSPYSIVMNGCQSSNYTLYSQLNRILLSQFKRQSE